MFLKVHPTPKGSIVAICDSEHMGKVISDGKLRLDLSAHASFYQGEKVTLAEASKALRGAENVNLVGKKAIRAAKNAGLGVSGAIDISGVPHLQLYRI